MNFNEIKMNRIRLKLAYLYTEIVSCFLPFQTCDIETTVSLNSLSFNRSSFFTPPQTSVILPPGLHLPFCLQVILITKTWLDEPKLTYRYLLGCRLSTFTAFSDQLLTVCPHIVLLFILISKDGWHGNIHCCCVLSDSEKKPKEAKITPFRLCELPSYM